jgi:UDP-2-acetamido-2-deoxy-ribo-hexuluronate aminotransferase
MRSLGRALGKRKKIAAEYGRRLAGLPKVSCPRVAPKAVHAFCLYVVDCSQRLSLQRKLAAAGIQSQTHYDIPVHRQPVHRKLYRKLKLPNTERASRRLLALPIFPELKKEELERICQTILSAA